MKIIFIAFNVYFNLNKIKIRINRLLTTYLVAISKTKLSEFWPGAAKVIGLVPNVELCERVGNTIGDVFVILMPIRFSFNAFKE